MTWAAIALAGALLASPSPADSALTVVVGATLLDGGAQAPLADSIVVIRGNAIAAVGDRMRTPIPKGATLVDGRKMWIAPVAADSTPGAALPAAIAAILRGPTARITAGQPAHLALLDADPRPSGSTAAVRRLWIAGKAREQTAGAAR